eukprot:753021-Hanusia_phi.AAC.2
MLVCPSRCLFSPIYSLALIPSLPVLPPCSAERLGAADLTPQDKLCSIPVEQIALPAEGGIGRSKRDRKKMEGGGGEGARKRGNESQRTK